MGGPKGDSEGSGQNGIVASLGGVAVRVSVAKAAAVQAVPHVRHRRHTNNEHDLARARDA